LVLSPHPDDDIFGCGGTLRLHHDQNDEINILYLSGNESRIAEAQTALEIIGINKFENLDMIDGKITDSQAVIDKITQRITDLKPKTIYAPCFVDPNSDHLATSKILAKALEKTNFDGEIFMYEIWSPIYANRLISIDKTIETKIKAMQAHQSQLKDRPYVDAFIGLSQYRANMFDHGKNAEAFFACDKETYIKTSKLFG